MGFDIDAALRRVAHAWEVDGDLMRCRECNRAIIASRRNEPMRHRSGCDNAPLLYPWAELMAALRMHIHTDEQ